MARGVLGSTRPQIAALTGIRAVAAGWVVLEHFKDPLLHLVPGSRVSTGVVEGGYLGVDVFFVLSGFIIAYTYGDRLRRFSRAEYRDFLLARFARIYPVHLVTLLAVGALVLGAVVLGRFSDTEGIFTPVNFVANLLMLQHVPPFQAFNTPAWSICCEAFAYLAFPVVAIAIARIRRVPGAFVAAAVIMAVGVAGMLIAPHVVPDSPVLPVVDWIRIATEFTTGALLYTGWSLLGPRRGHRAWDWVALGSVVALAVLLTVMPPVHDLPLAVVPLCALFVYATAASNGWLKRLFSTRLMQWGGRISFSVYMSHFLLLMVGQEVLPWQRLEGAPAVAGILLVVVYWLLSVALGAACYHLVEEPARRLIRRIVARREGEETVEPPELRGAGDDVAANGADVSSR